MKPTAKIVVISALLAFCSTSLADELLVPTQYPTIQSAIEVAVDGDQDGSVMVDMGAFEYQPGIICVDAGATGANNGSSWVNAYKYLQDALAVAEPNDAIWVAQGTYRPDENTGHPAGTNNRDATFQLKNGVVLYGGFPSGGGFWENRDPNTYETTLSGDIGVAGNKDNSYHIVIGSGTNPSAILDGFTVTAGNANGSSSRVRGAGMYNSPGSPTITNCTFSGNSANSGGGMENISSSPTITNCTFSGNSTLAGGGMYNYSSSRPTLTNCTFSGNSAYYGGGGMYNSSSSPTLTNCTFIGNNTSRDGGGMYNFSRSPTITNCTFTGNSASDYGGGMYNSFSNPTLANCILWGNTATSGLQIYNSSSTPTVSFSNVQDGWAGTGNIDADPCFVDDANKDYHLKPDSPCINTGDPNYIPEPNETDLDGLPRIIGGRIDMGAYEFNHQPVADAGPNQTAYAWIDGFADVNIDGSASFDDDNDVLDYYWSWTIDGNDYEANGITPTIKLPVGKHTIELVVDDGIDLSEPDYCTITVIKAVRGKLVISPRVIETKSCGKWILATLFIPSVPGEKVNTNEPLRLYPSGIEAKYQRFSRYGISRCAPTFALAYFDKQQVIDTLGTGQFDVSVVGKFLSGRFFFGSDTIRIIATPPHPKPPFFWH
jgi:parallel beta-helix repeat protein